MYKFIWRNGNKSRGKVLKTIYNKECLYDALRKIANEIVARDEWDYIDLEKNGKIIGTIYALSDGQFSELDFENLEYHIKYDL